MRSGLALCTLLVLSVSCKSRSQLRTDCNRVADHVADIIVDYFVANPNQLWEAVHAEPGDPGIPLTFTKATFPTFLSSDAGKRWIDRRRAIVQVGTHSIVEQCVQKASQKQIKCMLAATTREAVAACDKSD
jgi:hypothetical protein